jgi:hypothetical protein
MRPSPFRPKIDATFSRAFAPIRSRAISSILQLVDFKAAKPLECQGVGGLHEQFMQRKPVKARLQADKESVRGDEVVGHGFFIAAIFGAFVKHGIFLIELMGWPNKPPTPFSQEKPPPGTTPAVMG